MSGIKYELKGHDDLLTRLRKGVEYDDVKKVVRSNASEMTKAAIQNAPVDTGYLRRSIVMDLTDMIGKVQVTADYAPHVELGTRYMTAQPFLAPAFMKQRIKFLDDLKNVMK